MLSSKTQEEEDASINKKQLPDHNHVELICSVALDMIESSQSLKNPFDETAGNIKIKIGIHTGSIVAGIVGLSKIQFCLFGDTVNTSSRMCSNSVVCRLYLNTG